MCAAAQNGKKITESPLFSSFTVIRGYQCWYPRKGRHSSAVLVMISSKSVSVCNHSHAILVNGSRNLRTLTGIPKFEALVWRTPWT